MGKRIVVTGDSGKAGQQVTSYLLEQGHDILNLDLVPLSAELSDSVHTLRTRSGRQRTGIQCLQLAFPIDRAFP